LLALLYVYLGKHINFSLEEVVTSVGAAFVTRVTLG